MSYKTPSGKVRVWSYLSERVWSRLGELAGLHRRRLPEEFSIAVEEYVEREYEKLLVQHKGKA